jgi:hypothetical protein
MAQHGMMMMHRMMEMRSDINSAVRGRGGSAAAQQQCAAGRRNARSQPGRWLLLRPAGLPAWWLLVATAASLLHALSTLRRR